MVSIHAPTRGATTGVIPRAQYSEVSIHAPTRGATLILISVPTSYLFQSTHPRGVRRPTATRPSGLLCFNPRTHEGCDFFYLIDYLQSDSFNPRTHEGCDQAASKAWWGVPRFNPRTHEGCDVAEAPEPTELDVSIHAPTRGATHATQVNYNNEVVSIHAPTRGATLLLHLYLSDDCCFNPRTHEGCDLQRIHKQSHSLSFNPRTHEGCDLPFSILMLLPPCVSIHAPTRGATRVRTTDKTALMFQSTHPRGVRLYTIIISNNSIVFQSTHPRGVRHRIRRGKTSSNRFQSTHPRGVRHKFFIVYKRLKSFNPRTHEGCD